MQISLMHQLHWRHGNLTMDMFSIAWKWSDVGAPKSNTKDDLITVFCPFATPQTEEGNS